MALFPRKGGFLFSERWLRQNGSPALFGRITHVDQTKTIRITELREMALGADRLALQKLCEVLNQSVLGGKTKDVLKAAVTILGICGTIEQARADADRCFGSELSRMG